MYILLFYFNTRINWGCQHYIFIFTNKKHLQANATCTWYFLTIWVKYLHLLSRKKSKFNLESKFYLHNNYVSTIIIIKLNNIYIILIYT